MQLKNSPLAKTPPKNLPSIPGVTVKNVQLETDNTPIPEEPEIIKGKIKLYAYLLDLLFCFFLFITSRMTRH